MLLKTKLSLLKYKQYFTSQIKCSHTFNNKDCIVIGGGTGFIGNRLRSLLLQNNKKYDVKIISRVGTYEKHVLTWDDIYKYGFPKNTICVINLAGEKIMNPLKLFNNSFKDEIRISRVGTTAFLTDVINNSEYKPEVYINMTSVDIYPENTISTECTPCIKQPNNFFSSLWCECEKVASEVSSQVRRVTIRSGTVLDCNGGYVRSLYLPFYFGFGATMSNGCHHQPWIHMDDLCSLVIHCIQCSKMEGILNGVSPHIITNFQLSTSLGKAMNRSINFHYSERFLKLIFGSERSTYLLEDRVVSSEKMSNHGFQLYFSDIDEAMNNIIKRHCLI